MIKILSTEAFDVDPIFFLSKMKCLEIIKMLYKCLFETNKQAQFAMKEDRIGVRRVNACNPEEEKDCRWHFSVSLDTQDKGLEGAEW